MTHRNNAKINTTNRQTLKNYTNGGGFNFTKTKNGYDFSVKELFVSVGKQVGTEKGIILTSNNAKDWTLANTPDINTFNGVCYGKSMFVAVCGKEDDVPEKKSTIFSIDGVNWYPGSNIVNNWSSLCYGNNTFVSVASSGPNNKIMTSNDGKGWNLVNVKDDDDKEDDDDDDDDKEDDDDDDDDEEDDDDDDDDDEDDKEDKEDKEDEDVSPSGGKKTRKSKYKGHNTTQKIYYGGDNDAKIIIDNKSNPYKVLGVDKTTSLDDIKKAYRKLLIKFHPDRYKGEYKDELVQIIKTSFDNLKETKIKEEERKKKVKESKDRLTAAEKKVKEAKTEEEKTEAEKEFTEAKKQVKAENIIKNKNNYYKVLGVDNTASEKDITKAFKKLLRKYNPTDGEVFKIIQNAYIILKRYINSKELQSGITKEEDEQKALSELVEREEAKTRQRVQTLQAQLQSLREALPELKARERELYDRYIATQGEVRINNSPLLQEKLKTQLKEYQNLINQRTSAEEEINSLNDFLMRDDTLNQIILYQTLSPSDVNKNCKLNSVCYGNGTFVAVGDNIIISSKDCITWNKKIFELVESKHTKITSVCYGEKTFMAVGYETLDTSTTQMNGRGICLISNDGIIWTRIWIADLAYTSVCYGNVIFFAMGGNGFGYKSVNTGFIWRKQMVIEEDPKIINSVCYGKKYFVGTGERIVISEDCENWQAANPSYEPNRYVLNSVCCQSTISPGVYYSKDSYSPPVDNVDNYTYFLKKLNIGSYLITVPIFRDLAEFFKRKKGNKDNFYKDVNNATIVKWYKSNNEEVKIDDLLFKVSYRYGSERKVKKVYSSVNGYLLIIVESSPMVKKPIEYDFVVGVVLQPKYNTEPNKQKIINYFNSGNFYTGNPANQLYVPPMGITQSNYVLSKFKKYNTNIQYIDGYILSIPDDMFTYNINPVNITIDWNKKTGSEKIDIKDGVKIYEGDELFDMRFGNKGTTESHTVAVVSTVDGYLVILTTKGVYNRRDIIGAIVKKEEDVRKLHYYFDKIVPPTLGDGDDKTHYEVVSVKILNPQGFFLRMPSIRQLTRSQETRIVKYLVKQGDYISKGEPLIHVVTSINGRNISAIIYSTQNGWIEKLSIRDNSNIKPNDDILVIVNDYNNVGKKSFNNFLTPPTNLIQNYYLSKLSANTNVKKIKGWFLPIPVVENQEKDKQFVISIDSWIEKEGTYIKEGVDLFRMSYTNNLGTRVNVNVKSSVEGYLVILKQTNSVFKSKQIVGVVVQNKDDIQKIHDYLDVAEKPPGNYEQKRYSTISTKLVKPKGFFLKMPDINNNFGVYIKKCLVKHGDYVRKDTPMIIVEKNKDTNIFSTIYSSEEGWIRKLTNEDKIIDPDNIIAVVVFNPNDVDYNPSFIEVPYSEKKPDIIIPNQLNIQILTDIPGYQKFSFKPSMLIKSLDSSDSEVRFYPMVKLNKSVIDKIPERVRVKQFFNKGLFQSFINYINAKPLDRLILAKEYGYVDNNIKLTLQTIFATGSVITIGGKPYTIGDVRWTEGDWKIDSKQKAQEFDTRSITDPVLYSQLVQQNLTTAESQLKELEKSAPSAVYGSDFKGQLNEIKSEPTPSGPTPSGPTPIPRPTQYGPTPIPRPTDCIRELALSFSTIGFIKLFEYGNTLYQLINELYKQQQVKEYIYNVFKTTTDIAVVPNSINISRDAYRQLYDGFKIVRNSGSGDCFFLAVSQAINIYNCNNPDDRLTVPFKTYTDTDREKIIDQSDIRRLVWEYIEIDKNSKKALEGREDISELSESEKKDYIMSGNYWGNDVAMEAVRYFLQINILVISLQSSGQFIVPLNGVQYLEELKFSPGETLEEREKIKEIDRIKKGWDKYLFLYNTTDTHFELFTFKYKEKNRDTGKHKDVIYTLFKKDEIYKFPIFVLFFFFFKVYLPLIKTKNDDGSMYENKDSTFERNADKYIAFKSVNDILANAFQDLMSERNGIKNTVFCNNLQKFKSDMKCKNFEGYIKTEDDTTEEEREREREKQWKQYLRNLITVFNRLKITVSSRKNKLTEDKKERINHFNTSIEGMIKDIQKLKYPEDLNGYKEAFDTMNDEKNNILETLREGETRKGAQEGETEEDETRKGAQEGETEKGETEEGETQEGETGKNESQEKSVKTVDPIILLKRCIINSRKKSKTVRKCTNETIIQYMNLLKVQHSLEGYESLPKDKKELIGLAQKMVEEIESKKGGNPPMYQQQYNQYPYPYQNPYPYRPFVKPVMQDIDPSKLAYSITVALELYPGTEIPKDKLAKVQCNSRWEAVRKAWAEFTGKPYIIAPKYKYIENDASKKSQKNARTYSNRNDANRMYPNRTYSNRNDANRNFSNRNDANRNYPNRTYANRNYVKM